MYSNGTIKYWINPNSDNEGLNEKGNPINFSKDKNVVWSKPIPCLIKVNRRDTVGYITENEKFEVARYIIHIEVDSFEENTTIQLTDDMKRDLGTFKIRDVQRSRVMNRIALMI